MATINATPFPYEFDIDHIALVCIDMQRDFCLAGGFAESLGNNLANLAPCIQVMSICLSLRATSMMKTAPILPAASSYTHPVPSTRRAASEAAWRY